MLIGGLAVALSLGFLAAKVVGDVKRFPFGVANEVGDRVAAAIRSALDGRPASGETAENLELFSTFVPIVGGRVEIPRSSRDGEGGGLTSAGDDVLLVTHDGRVFAVDPAGGVTPTRIELPSNGFEGYYAASEDARYADFYFDLRTLRYNDILYVDDDGPPALLLSFTRFYRERECFTTVVARLRPNDAGSAIGQWQARPADWQVLFESAPCLPLKKTFRAIEGHMAGGRMAYAGAGELYLTMGDYSWDGVYGPYHPTAGAQPLAQDPDTDYGKVIRIDLVSGTAERLTRGHRNPQGVAIDADGTVWVVEQGPRGGDELNRVERGFNYGWPLESYGTMNSGLPIPGVESQGFHDEYVRPMFAWLPSIATSSLAYVEGFHETWDGDLLVGSLRGKRLVRIRHREGRTVFAEEIPVGFRIRYVLQHSDGRIVLWNGTDELVFLSPVAGGLGYRFAMYLLDRELKVTPAVKTKVAAALTTCIECHSLDEGNHATAPSLAKVHGSRVGATAYAGYSAAMRGHSGVWTTELLDGFLLDPGALVPGTPMASFAVTDPEVREPLVSLLEELATRKEIPLAFRW